MKKFLIVLFFVIPTLLSAIIFFTPDKSNSDNENRTLKTRKQITIENFQDDTENFLSDQFPLREGIVSAHSQILYMLGKRDINSAYIGKNRLFQKITESDIDEGACIRYADRINGFAKTTDTYVMLIPSAATVLQNELPANAETYNYKKLFGTMREHMPDANIGILKNISYYKTDHHWNCDGSYSAYVEWCRLHKTTPRDFEFETVTKNFKGTLYSKALLWGYDAEEIKAPVINTDITVTADGQKISLYDNKALETSNKYNYFEGGNHGIVEIENPNNNNGKVLLILKDSFANSFVPYIIDDYQKIIMLDERYSLSLPEDIMESEGVTELAVIKEIIGS